MHNTFIEDYARTFTYPYAITKANTNFEKTILGKRRLISGLLSADLAYNMQLYYEGYDPHTLLEESASKLAFERERMRNQPFDVEPFSAYLEHTSEEPPIIARQCANCKALADNIAAGKVIEKGAFLCSKCAFHEEVSIESKKPKAPKSGCAICNGSD
jgi:hypothetical protein